MARCKRLDGQTGIQSEVDDLAEGVNARVGTPGSEHGNRLL